MAMTKFAGSVAVITGGASGIGFATAAALRERGAHVVLADINGEGAQKAGERLRQDDPGAQGEVLAIPVDVTNEGQVQELMKRTEEAFGSIDLVVTCAGIARGGSVDTFSSGDMQALMNINFIGTFLCVKAALPAMRRQGSGYFVCISSVAGKLGTPMISGYCASKWAVRGFTAALRAELYGTGIGVTTVYPAWVDTPMVQQETELAKGLIKAGALLKPEQVASEILQAVTEGRRDLTLAPNPDDAFVLQLFASDQDKAEDVMGRAMQRQLANMPKQSS